MFEIKYKTKKKKDKIELSYNLGSYPDLYGKKAAKMVDTGNGFIAKFYSCSSAEQDHYVGLDYSQAEELYLMLKGMLGK